MSTRRAKPDCETTAFIKSISPYKVKRYPRNDNYKTYYLSGGPFDGQLRRCCSTSYDIAAKHRRVTTGKNFYTGVYQANGKTRKYLGFPYPVMEWQG